ncbi:oxidoreductase family protein [Draconibacterium sp. IB214405]|uniref:oxidoreductase family protein n=1 Tax=Draconibacterium sp. IB214405 TaxID=3097352 RepID=UPI002A14B112|nr:oxidoreductase family protein [Draconibacterium sp. IB214405]MDX8340410.1 oxidoreductase family protein [Draconibacterium sp. IB214405]
MNSHFQELILQSTGAKNLHKIEVIQSLWSGYGEIVRFGLEGCELESVVVKHVNLPEGGSHPRGWNTDLSHQRKLKSYKVETEWYKSFNKNCDDNCKTPQCYALETKGSEVLMVFEDLDSTGFAERLSSSVNWDNINACLFWLANFHATFMGVKPEGLWRIGTYWHLETRPEELEAMDDLPLKNAALAIDKKLSDSPFQTLVHGDAKLANFCFSDNGKNVAAVDFQYVGGGCGMKDLAYFIGSCMSENDCEKYEHKLLDMYFAHLSDALQKKNSTVDFKALENDWRNLYHVAWADFHRFLKGWHPGHWKINSYSERVSREVIEKLTV